MSRKEIIKKIRDAGVVGAGGAGFPAYRKLDGSVDNIIVNGAECEPLLYKDREALIQGRERLIDGLNIMREITGAKRVTIAVKDKNKDVLELYQPAVQKHGFDCHVSDDVYPSGDEYVLVYEVTGQQIPPGGIPLQVGCIVSNVETIINVANAVDGVPVTEKYLTVAGAVHEPITTKVPIGTTFQECIALAGGATVDSMTVLTGGVMMGGVESDVSLPVTKTIGGLIVLPSDHYLVKRKTAPRETYTRIGHGQCDQCSMCTQMCPRYILGYPIEPHQVMRTLMMTGEAKERNSLWAQYCCECNICTLIACPEDLDPKSICVDAKALLRENQMSRTESELEILFRPPHPAREGRQVPSSTVARRLGLNPYQRKAPYIETDYRPHRVSIPFNSHIGAPGSPQVKVGDHVSQGQLIADVAGDKLGCPSHASISGRVTNVDDTSIEISV